MPNFPSDKIIVKQYIYLFAKSLHNLLFEVNLMCVCALVKCGMNYKFTK